MMEKQMKKYREQMDRITLSDDADQAILDDLMKADTGKKVLYMKRAKRNLSAAAVALIVVAAFSVTVFAGVAIHRTIIKSGKSEPQTGGIGTAVDIGDSYYFDLLAGDAGEIYALTDSDYNGELTDHHAVVWKSTDQADTWEEVLAQPAELNAESDLIAGDLRIGKNGIEAVVIICEENVQSEGSYVNRVYQITENSYVEYEMNEVYDLLGDQDHLFNVKFVNDNTLALVGAEACLLYDVNTQKIVKTLPYGLTMGCLLTQDQFLLYGKEIYSCLDAESLEEQEPEAGLREFVQAMYEKNNHEVFPPMQAQDDIVVCVTKSGIYEYKDGAYTHIKRLSNTLGRIFNGLLPVCKTREGEYYVCTLSGTGMTIWQIDGDKEEMK